MFEEERLWFGILLKTEPFHAGQTELPGNKAGENKGSRRQGGRGAEPVPCPVLSPCPAGLRCSCKGACPAGASPGPSPPSPPFPPQHPSGGCCATSPSLAGCGDSAHHPSCSMPRHQGTPLHRALLRAAQSTISSLFQTVCSSYTL